MIIDNVKTIMEKVEKITLDLGDAITKDDYYIEDMGCPHKQPPRLPKGYSAVYMFAYGSETEFEFLKIGKANAKSTARFISQHYGLNATSTLAKSICSDKEFQELGIISDNVKNWMLNNLHRINIYIKEERGKAVTEVIETIMHYAFRPRYEGNI
ncbi:MAG: hypothetical protein K5765_00895 [Clostridia bacterium]|nr:hypothetical protein [Clostridia bacterium]